MAHLLQGGWHIYRPHLLYQNWCTKPCLRSWGLEVQRPHLLYRDWGRNAVPPSLGLKHTYHASFIGTDRLHTFFNRTGAKRYRAYAFLTGTEAQATPPLSQLKLSGRTSSQRPNLLHWYLKIQSPCLLNWNWGSGHTSIIKIKAQRPHLLYQNRSSKTTPPSLLQKPRSHASFNET